MRTPDRMHLSRGHAHAHQVHAPWPVSAPHLNLRWRRAPRKHGERRRRNDNRGQRTAAHYSHGE